MEKWTRESEYSRLPWSNNSGGLEENAAVALPSLSAESCLLKNKGEYTIQEKLGSGFSAIVYRAVEKKTRKNYAIKYATKERQRLVNNESEYRKTFAAIKALQSPYIVKYHSLIEDEQAFLLIMECCLGGDLIKFLKDCIMEESTCKRIMFQLFQAVQILHKSGILHRDIKLDNIMFKSKQKSDIALGDFDMCLLINKNSPANPGQVKVVGTHRYMAPESAQEGNYSTASDMWCCGVVMHALFSRYFPCIKRSSSAGFKARCAIDSETATKYPAATDLMYQLLDINPESRITCENALNHVWFNSIPYTISAEFWRRSGRKRVRGAGWKNLEINSKVLSQNNSSTLTKSPLRYVACSVPQGNALPQFPHCIPRTTTASRVVQLPSSQLRCGVNTPTRFPISAATTIFRNSIATYSSQLNSISKLCINSLVEQNGKLDKTPVKSPITKPAGDSTSYGELGALTKTPQQSKANNNMTANSSITTAPKFRTRGALHLSNQTNAKSKKLDCMRFAAILDSPQHGESKGAPVTPDKKTAQFTVNDTAKPGIYCENMNAVKKIATRSIKRKLEVSNNADENIITSNTKDFEEKHEKIGVQMENCGSTKLKGRRTNASCG